ncbi:class I SAM-dependent methyltransferase [Rhodococcus aerolatus]
MGLYTDRVLPRLIDVALGRGVEALRAEVCAGLHGTVVEVGFGSGRNVAHYPAAVSRVLAVDPSPGGRALAADRIAASPVPVEWVGLDGQRLPLAAGSADAVLSTWTLCTIPDVATALAEVRRVLRPGGTLHVLEHGRSPRPGVAAWQHRLGPVWGRLAGGCHLDRPVPDLLRAAGFEVDGLRTFVEGPELSGRLFLGEARTQDVPPDRENCRTPLP